MVVHCAQVRNTYRTFNGKDVNSVSHVANGNAAVISTSRDTSSAMDSKLHRSLLHCRNHGNYSFRDLHQSLAPKNQSTRGKAISKSLEHLPSISVSRQRKRIIHRQSSLTLVGDDLPVAFKGKGAFSSKPSSRWSLPKIQIDLENSWEQGDNARDCVEKSLGETDADVSAIPSFLPPLPAGSLIYQAALRDTYFERDGASSSCNSESSNDSGSDADSGCSTSRRRKVKRCWCGPIVEYKGQHIYLSTLENIHLNLGRYGIRRWQ